MRKRLPVEEKVKRERRRQALGTAALCECDIAHDNRESPEITYINENYVNSFTEKLHPKGTGLFLFGFTGSGKTWLAASIVNELTDRGLRCKYTSMLKIVTDLNNLKNESRDHYLSQLWKVDLLVLDDFGMEAENNTSTNILNLIVSNCRELRVPIIVVTPYLEDQLTKDNSSNKRVHALKHLKERCLTVTLPLPGSRCAASYKQKTETEAIIKKGLPAPGKQQRLPFGDR